MEQKELIFKNLLINIGTIINQIVFTVLEKLTPSFPIKINPQFIKSIPSRFEFLLILFIFVNV